MGTLILLGCVVLAIGALVALDGFVAGRKGRRSLRSAADGEADNANVGYAMVQQQIKDLDQRHDMP